MEIPTAPSKRHLASRLIVLGCVAEGCRRCDRIVRSRRTARRWLGDGSVEAREGEMRLVGRRHLVHRGLALDRAFSLRRGGEVAREGIPIAPPFATRIRCKGLADNAMRQLERLFAAKGVMHFQD